MSKKPKQRDYYEILGLTFSKDITADDIKKAYRKAAFTWHPDRNPDNVAEATEKFREIQVAYETLSDPRERAWYDEHRDAIIKGREDVDGTVIQPDFINIWEYFSSDCYSEMDDSEDGFFTVYNKLFKTLDEEEKEYAEKGKYKKMPSFGNSKSSFAEVNRFYEAWSKFSTKKSYAWVDEYKLSEAPNRQVRRMMEIENQKKRDEAKRKFNDSVRHLVSTIRKRDIRIVRELEKRQREKENREKKQKEEEEFKKEVMKKLKEQEKKEKNYGEGVDYVDEDLEEDVLSYFDQLEEKKRKEKKEAQKEEEEEEDMPAEKRNALLKKQRKQKQKEKQQMKKQKRMQKEAQKEAQKEEEEEKIETEEPKMESEIPIIEKDSSDEEFANKRQSKKIKKKKKTKYIDADFEKDFEELHIDKKPEDEEGLKEEILDSREEKRKAKREKRRQKRREKEEQKQNIFKCNVCSAEFPTRNSLFKHIKVEGHELHIGGNEKRTRKKK